ncbi:hypothetical protein NQ318_013614 [Aromia moschata]|uniref:Bola-like protein n=1 Tax=Aromia moschata TaxID=1265417 RepID=A0AAV8YL44_9CUCU|nr:hypothetical protein NQ318_013614 [Aromia moschata]
MEHSFLSSTSRQAMGPVTDSEIMNTLRSKFPGAKIINVEDTSGGCGAMFNVSIETSEFKGLTIMKQHRLVYDVLKDQIKNIHGLHLETRAPK